ncbi:MAG: thioredoxin domain-containing protein [Anaerolineae bacterium]
MPNHLAGESSRYLQQHADNPVDWYPWGKTALDKARREDKPIFLSIGYSACHWCHVMAHESFEDEETAALLNAHFVSIKVDREERPDLDRIYMAAVQAMTGRGGWPMSVLITPDGTPFYGGTYFPKEPRYNMPSFKQVLAAIADAWENRRSELLRGGERVLAAVKQQYGLPTVIDGEALSPDTIESAYQVLKRSLDRVHGGWGGAPKFPQPMTLEFLLRYHHTTEDPQALAMVTQTLDAMARGGIYDQVGGGFHRYAVDANWLTPHFEKMLYDNALLARVYLHAWQVTGNEFFRAVVEETLDYVMREMMSPEGGFYATQDADTEGREGKFYVWTVDEIRNALGGPATRFLALYGVSEAGNFEGRNILTFQGTFEEREAIASARQRLFEARERRTPPGRDEKVLTSWNGLMLAAFAEAARVLESDRYLTVAQRNANFLLRGVRTPDGRLWHVWKAGETNVAGLLEDYSHLTEGLLALYQTDFDPRWYLAARELAGEMVAHFAAADDDGSRVGFYDIADDGPDLVVRPREMQDNAMPSGNAMAATVLQKLARFDAGGGSETSQPAEGLDLEGLARRMIAAMGERLATHPLAFGQWLNALNDAVASSIEVAVIGDPSVADTRKLLRVANQGYHPHLLIAAGIGEIPPLLAYREQLDGKATAYLCRSHVCLEPVTDADALESRFL